MSAMREGHFYGHEVNCNEKSQRQSAVKMIEGPKFSTHATSCVQYSYQRSCQFTNDLSNRGQSQKHITRGSRGGTKIFTVKQGMYIMNVNRHNFNFMLTLAICFIQVADCIPSVSKTDQMGEPTDKRLAYRQDDKRNTATINIQQSNP